MQITITGHQLDITEALRDYINNKFAKLERHFDKITSIRVTLGVEKSQTENRCHVTDCRWRY